MRHLTLIFALALLVAACTRTNSYTSQQSTGLLRLVRTIPLPNVEGRIDHLDVDVKGRRLFVAALGNNTVEVLDLKRGARTQSLRGFNEPQGIRQKQVRIRTMFSTTARSGGFMPASEKAR